MNFPKLSFIMKSLLFLILTFIVYTFPPTIFAQSCVVNPNCPLGQWQTVCPDISPRTCCQSAQWCPEPSTATPTSAPPTQPPVNPPPQNTGSACCNPGWAYREEDNMCHALTGAGNLEMDILCQNNYICRSGICVDPNTAPTLTPVPTGSNSSCRMCNGAPRAGESVCPGNGYVCCVDINDCTRFDPPECVSCSVARAYPGYIICDSNQNLCCRSQEACNNVEDIKDIPPPPFQLCDTTTDQTSYDECFSCLSNNGIWTALGCIPTSPEGFSGAFLSIAIAAGGGLALLLMLYGAFLMATSAGNPEANQKGKQVFGGAITGLLFIIFSVVLLQIIGIEILQIPGL